MSRTAARPTRTPAGRRRHRARAWSRRSPARCRRPCRPCRHRCPAGWPPSSPTAAPRSCRGSTRPGATRYDVQVDDTPGFASPEVVDQHGQQHLRPDPQPRGRATQYWRVRAFNASGDPSGYTESTFTKAAVEVPVLVSPGQRHEPPAADRPAGADLEPVSRRDQLPRRGGRRQRLRRLEHRTRSRAPRWSCPTRWAAGDWFWRVVAAKDNNLKSPASAASLVRRRGHPGAGDHLAPRRPQLPDPGRRPGLEAGPGRGVLRGRGGDQHRLQRRVAHRPPHRHPRQPLLPGDDLRQQRVLLARPRRGHRRSADAVDRGALQLQPDVAAASGAGLPGSDGQRGGARSPVLPVAARGARLGVRVPGRDPGELQRRHLQELPRCGHDVHARHVQREQHRHPHRLPGERGLYPGHRRDQLLAGAGTGPTVRQGRRAFPASRACSRPLKASSTPPTASPT